VIASRLTGHALAHNCTKAIERDTGVSEIRVRTILSDSQGTALLIPAPRRFRGCCRTSPPSAPGACPMPSAPTSASAMRHRPIPARVGSQNCKQQFLLHGLLSPFSHCVLWSTQYPTNNRCFGHIFRLQAPSSKQFQYLLQWGCQNRQVSSVLDSDVTLHTSRSNSQWNPTGADSAMLGSRTMCVWIRRPLPVRPLRACISEELSQKTRNRSVQRSMCQLTS